MCSAAPNDVESCPAAGTATNKAVAVAARQCSLKRGVVMSIHPG
jgi:hypothetical protein